MNVIAKGDASPRAPGVVASADGFRDGDFGEEPEQPYVCPGCYAVGGEPCAADCIDLAIEQEAEDEANREPAGDDDAGDDEGCIADDCTECDCSRCQGDQARWEAWQGWSSEGLGDESDADDGEIPF